MTTNEKNITGATFDDLNAADAAALTGATDAGQIISWVVQSLQASMQLSIMSYGMYQSYINPYAPQAQATPQAQTAK